MGGFKAGEPEKDGATQCVKLRFVPRRASKLHNTSGAWVAKFATRCSVKGDDDRFAYEACPSCGGSTEPTPLGFTPEPTTKPTAPKPTSATVSGKARRARGLLVEFRPFLLEIA